MWALVEDNSITKIFNSAKSLVIDDVQYPSNIFQLWSAEDLADVGLYPVSIDETNKKDTEYYNNTEITYAYSSGAVTGTYGSATAKSLDNILFTAQDETDGLGTEGEVEKYGLKHWHKQKINDYARNLLEDTDWMVIRAADGGTAVPSNVATYRAAVRTKANEHTTAIDAASDVDALAALEYDWPTLGS
jgi:hypothetical protein